MSDLRRGDGQGQADDAAAHDSSAHGCPAARIPVQAATVIPGAPGDLDGGLVDDGAAAQRRGTARGGEAGEGFSCGHRPLQQQLHISARERQLEPADHEGLAAAVGPLKIDAAVASFLAWQARIDSRAAGAGRAPARKQYRAAGF